MLIHYSNKRVLEIWYFILMIRFILHTINITVYTNILFEIYQDSGDINLSLK